MPSHRLSGRALAVLGVGVAVVVGVALRLWGLRDQIIFGDELHAILTVVNLDLIEILRSYRLADHCMPMSAYDWLLREAGLQLTETLVRLPSLISGMLTLVVLPAAVRQITDRGTATALAWLLALSPTLVFYSRIGRPYAVIVLLGFLAAASFWWFHETGRLRWGGAYALFGALTIWSHPGVAPFVAAPLAFGGLDALVGGRSRRFRRLAAIAGIAALLGALVALFLVPAWSSFVRLLSLKGASSAPKSWDIAGAMMLQAGSGVPWVAGLFWVLALVGFWTLWRGNRPVALYSGTLLLAQVVALVVFRPYRLESALVLNRYLLVVLPVILLWVAHGLKGLWMVKRVRLVGRASAAIVVCGLMATNPYSTDPWLRFGPFGASNAAAAFFKPAAELPSSVVPAVYRLLGQEGGRGAVVEVPSDNAWFRVRPELDLARVHGRPLIFATDEKWRRKSGLSFRTLVAAEPEAVAESGARFVVVDLDRQRLWRTITMMQRRGMNPQELGAKNLEHLVPPTPARSEQVQFARRMAARFEAAWGPPQFVDGTIRVWDLVVVAGRSEGSGGAVRP